MGEAGKVTITRTQGRPAPLCNWVVLEFYRFVEVADVAIAEEYYGAKGLFGGVKGAEGVTVEFLHGVGVKDYGEVVPMTTMSCLDNVPLCGEGGHPCAGTYPLYVYYYHRDFHHVGQPYALLHEGETRTTGSRHYLKPCQGGPYTGVYGGYLVLHL